MINKKIKRLLFIALILMTPLLFITSDCWAPNVIVTCSDNSTVISDCLGPSFRVQINNSCTGVGISQAKARTVRETPASGTCTFEAFTTPDGLSYYISPCGGGRYPVTIEAEGYESNVIEVFLPNSNTSLTYYAYLIPNSPSCNPIWTRCISGIVSNSNARLANYTNVQGLNVQLYRAGCSVTLSQSTTTDLGGRYRFTGLTDGSYKVKIVAPTGFIAEPAEYSINIPQTVPKLNDFWLDPN